MLKGRQYYGSLIMFKSELTDIEFIFEENTVKYNYFLGDFTSLIVINGGIINIKNNLLRNNGYLSTTVISNHPDSVTLLKDQIFPYG